MISLLLNTNCKTTRKIRAAAEGEDPDFIGGNTDITKEITYSTGITTIGATSSVVPEKDKNGISTGRFLADGGTFVKHEMVTVSYSITISLNDGYSKTVTYDSLDKLNQYKKLAQGYLDNNNVTYKISDVITNKEMKTTNLGNVLDPNDY